MKPSYALLIFYAVLMAASAWLYGVVAPKIVREPEEVVNRIGNNPPRGPFEAPRQGGSGEISNVVNMKVTAYCPGRCCCGKFADGKTATGDDANVCDGVAADFSLLPRRTKLRIPGVGVREVDDTGGAMRQSAENGLYHIDVRFASHRKARQFGVKWLDVEVLTN